MNDAFAPRFETGKRLCHMTCMMRAKIGLFVKVTDMHSKEYEGSFMVAEYILAQTGMQEFGASDRYR